MKKLLITLVFVAAVTQAFPQTSYVYPGKNWQTAQPEDYGFSSEKFRQIEKFISDSMQTTGMMVIVSGKVIYSYGKLKNISYIASCRKSLLAMLYGKYVENGTINLDTTIGELGLDDVGGLLPIEKQATIRHLVTARSGVYHDASNDGDDAASRPARGSKVPGEYYLYNNWDFNAAGVVFEMLTKQNIYRAFKNDIGDRIGFEDFSLGNQEKGGDLSLSKFPSYHFYLSTRDMARIGYLMLREGDWNGDQVISKQWVREITGTVTPMEDLNPESRKDVFDYGYMWWVFNVPELPVLKGAYTAKGMKGQFITVIPRLDMVIAHKTDPAGGRRTRFATYYKLIQKIIDK